MHSNCVYIYIYIQFKRKLGQRKYYLSIFFGSACAQCPSNMKSKNTVYVSTYYFFYYVLSVQREWSYKVYKNAHLFLTVHLARNIQIHSSYSFGSVPILSDGTKVRTAYCWQIKMTKVSLPPPIKVNKMKKCYHALHYCIANTQDPCLT